MKPTVTDLINLLDKPALLKWANKLGLQGTSLDDYRSKSKSGGTDIHKQIENDLKHGIKFENERYQAFRSRYEFIQCEIEVDCDHYRGRADVLMKRDGLLWLFDFKASDKVYFEQKLQAMAYKRVLGAHKVGIVHTESFIESIIDVPLDHERHYYNIIGALYNIWKAKQALQ